MKSSSCRDMEVFDFNLEDEPGDDKYLGKFKNPSVNDDSILKYKFLECVPPVSSNISTRQTDVPCVDVDELKDDCLEEKYTYTPREDKATQQFQPNFSFSMLFDTLSGAPHNHCSLSNQKCGNSCSESAIRSPSPVASPARRTDSASESPSNEECADVTSDVDDSMNSQASSVASDVEEDVSLEGQARNDHISSPLVGSDEGLLILPEYAVYRGDYYPEPLLAFSPSGVKFKGSATNLEVKSISVECAVDDIVNISGQWLPKVETVMIKILIISKDAVQVDSMQESSGAEELKFAVIDAHWPRKQEIIRALNGKYADVWDVVIDANMGMDVVDASGQRSYFPSFDEPFEELVYPKGDSDAVSISKGDVDLLQPETFINDTIIDFYIKYLKNQIPHEERQRFYFFNSFFFRKLADLDKDPNSASDGKAAFLRVRKWTRKFNLFKKDYIFIPVNYSLHWSLIVICHPGEVANFGDEDSPESAKVPCILHMDSIRGSHAGLKNLIQCYLWEEWKEKGNETSEHISEKFANVRFVHLELPQQENSYDCGLFLLHYLELFLTQAPPTFDPMKVFKLSRFLNPDWFPPVEASLKRTVIQKLIHELLGGQSQDSDGNHSSKTVNTKIESGFTGTSLAETCGSVVACRSIPQASNTIEISLLPEADSSLRNPQSTNNEPGIVLREFFESEPTTGSFLGSCQSYDQPSYYPLDTNPVSAMEVEDVDVGTDFGFAPYGGTEETHYAEINRVAPQSDCISLGLLENTEDKVVADSLVASPRSPDITIYDSTNDKDANLFDAENLEHFESTETACCSAEVVLEGMEVDKVMQKSEEDLLGIWGIDKEGKLEEVPLEAQDVDIMNLMEDTKLEGKLEEVPLETQDADKMNLIQDTKEEMISETMDGETKEYATPPQSPVKSLHQEEDEPELCLVGEDEDEDDALRVEIGTEDLSSKHGDVSDITVVVDAEDEQPDAKRRRLLEDNDLHQ